MIIIYRISDSGYNKIKPPYINNENCLRNALSVFPHSVFNWLIIADNISPQTEEMIRKYYPGEIKHVSVGHGAGTFNIALTEAIQSGEDYIYFLENDYIHKQGSPDIIYEGLERFGADYITLYDHPDKYIPASKGGNPFIDEDGSEITKLYLGDKCHYKLCFSTTMTFGAKRSTLIKHEHILRKWTQGSYPEDFKMFTEITKELGGSMLCPIPGYCTHGETHWLTPFTDWENEILKNHPNYNMS